MTRETYGAGLIVAQVAGFAAEDLIRECSIADQHGQHDSGAD